MPALVEPRAEGSLADLPARRAERDPGAVAFAIRSGSGWSNLSAGQFHADVRAVAKGLVSEGIAPGDRVAIMARTRYEWTLLDFAVWTAGGVVVPIYETSSADQVRWILEDSGARAAVVETSAHETTVGEAQTGLLSPVRVWQIDAGAVDQLRTAGASVSDDQLEATRTAVDRSSVATIIYTSGTTGRPKGCELTHGNFLSLSENAVERLSSVVKADGAATLLFLPLAHVFARFIEVLCVDAGVRMGHSADIKGVLGDFATFQPTFFLAVPRVFEKIFNSAEARATADGRGRIFAAATAAAIAYSEALDTGKLPLALRARHAVFSRLVFSRLRAAMGGKVQYAVSGGAPLGTRLGHYFRGIGVTILEGYGLTETTAPATVNVPERAKIGTVGPPLPGVSLRIADDGEILVKGINVFARYHNNPEATAEVIRDGWFHTGDLGELDADGYLRITGRMKEILVTAAGKNVAPAVLEDRLRAHPIVSQCIVVGDQKPFVGALITLDSEMLPMWARANGVQGVTMASATSDERIIAELQRAVDDANQAVSRAESIRKWAVLETDFTEESGHLTPSLKLKRNLVMRDFAAEVEDLYQG
jgi:long-chain acyl-CoA synthetase